MKEIQLTQGKSTHVDDEDFEFLSQWKWHAAKDRHTCYAKRTTARDVHGKQATIRMHEVLIGKPAKGFKCDHIDGNGLNNQRSNLRIITNRQNAQNRHDYKTSKYPGVSWGRREKRWIARIQINKKIKSLGSFVNEEEAFFAYRQESIRTGSDVMVGRGEMGI